MAELGESNAGNPRIAAPEGISPFFWNQMLHGELGKKFREQLAAKGGYSGNQLDRAAAEWATKQWNKLTPERREQWVAQDKSGSHAVPGSHEWEAEQEAIEAETLGTEQLEALEGWVTGELGDLKEVAEQASLGNHEALAKLEDLLSKIEDPKLAEYVGNYISQAATAKASDRAIEEQWAQYEKLSALTDPRLTDAERAMMLEARMGQERDMASNREAYKKDLQARGMFGSGAELTMNLASAQQLANTRALEELKAQGMASDRAFDATKEANTVIGAIEKQQFEEDKARKEAADTATRFNNELRTNYDNWRAQNEIAINKGKESRAGTVADFTKGVNASDVEISEILADMGLEGVEARNKIKGDKTAAGVAARKKGANARTAAGVPGMEGLPE